MTQHYCENEISNKEAIGWCTEQEDGTLWVEDEECGTQVNYCPFCGYKAKTPIKEGISATELLQTNDAVVWAQGFIECKKRNRWTLADIDEALMVGWFANAMTAQEMNQKY